MKKYWPILLAFISMILLAAEVSGQAFLLTGINQQRESAPQAEVFINFIDNDPQGTSNGQNSYSGTWVLPGSKADAYNQTFSYTNAGTDDGNNANDPYVNVYFNGFQVGIAAERYPSHGIMAVSIDGGAEVEVDQYSSINSETMVNGVPQIIWTSTTLSNGDHILKIRNTGKKNTLSSGTYTVVDAVQVSATSAPTTPAPATGTLFVRKTGNDANPCSTGSPCLTVQRALNIAVPGDIVNIGAGTYRETPTPVNSGTAGHPIIIQAASGATVIISGLESISDGAWTSHDLTGGKQIYKAAVSNGALYTEKMTGFNTNNLQYNNTQLLAQQLFKGGSMQFQASWPVPTSVSNILERSSQRSRMDATGDVFGDTQVQDAAFPAGDFTGGKIWVQGWFVTRTRNITAHNTGTDVLTYESTTDGGDHAFSNFYKIFGDYDLLQVATQWHYDGTYFYFWQTGGGSPTGVEYKKRNWGFDLRNKSYITVEGITFIGCDPVMTTSSSTNITIDNIRATYTSHHMLESDGGSNNGFGGSGYYNSPVQTGTKLLGANSIIKNSEFNYASGTVLWLGSNTTAQNNKFQNGNYAGFYNAFIKLAFSGTTGSSNVKILNNTFQRVGRAHIDLGGESFDLIHSNIEIGYNDFSGHGMMNVDFGAIYAARRTVMNGNNVSSRFHHNYFHDPLFDEDGTGQQRGIQVTGNYFDMASGPVMYDHNVHWNGVSGSGRSGAYASDFYTQSYAPDVGNRLQNGKSTLYNNIFATVTSGGQYSYVVYNNRSDVKDIQRNNIYRAQIIQDWGINGATPDTDASVVTSGTNPLWAGGSLSNPGAYFQLGSGSPARGIGISLPGINDDDTSPKDSGAFGYSQAVWTTPGYSAVSYTPTP